MILLNANIEAFLAVVEHSTVSMAAQQIGLTQTAVTQRIKALERDLGTSVFTRSRKGMKLTEQGLRLYQHCLEVKDTEGRLRSAIDGAGVEQPVNCWISGPASVIGGRVVEQVSELYSKWPMLNLNFIYETNKNRIELLKTGKVDFAVLTSKSDDELEYKKIAPWTFVMVVPFHWKGRSIDSVVEKERFFHYDPADDICSVYMRKYKLAKKMRGPALYVNDNQAMLELIARGVGYGVLPIEVLDEKIQSKQIHILNRGRTLEIPMSLAWYPRKEPPEYFQNIIAAVE